MLTSSRCWADRDQCPVGRCAGLGSKARSVEESAPAHNPDGVMPGTDVASTVCSMPYFIGGGIIYIVLLVVFGILSIRKGHWVMFILGFIFPLFWLIGGMMPPVAA